LKRIDSIVRNVLDNFEPDIHDKRRRVISMWDSIVGEQLSRHARPEGYTDSVLLLRTLHPAAVMEIKLKKREILKRINDLWKQEIFTDIRTASC